MAGRCFLAGLLWTAILVGSLVRHTTCCESGARDDVLRGIPTTAIAGLFPFSLSMDKLYLRPMLRLCRIVHRSNQRPRRQDDLGGAEKPGAEVPRNTFEVRRRRRLCHGPNSYWRIKGGKP